MTTQRMQPRRTRRALVVLAAAPLALAACGTASSATSHSATSSPSGASSAAAPVSVRAAGSAGKILVDAKGRTLYSPVQEKSGMIKCTGSCTAIWPPATVSSGMTVPHSVPGASGTLGTLHRPDGATQLTFNGAPLYRFVTDRQPGSVSGNGTMDSFNGTSFTWHVVPANGAAAPTGTSSPSGGGNHNGGGYGGY